MAVIPIAVGETVDYTLPTDEEPKTVWKLKILDTLTRYRLWYAVKGLADEALQAASEDRPVTPEYLESALNICRFGLAGWTLKDVPFRTEKRKEWGREFDVVPDDLLVRIPIEVTSVLALAILNANSLSADEKKAQDSPGEAGSS